MAIASEPRWMTVAVRKKSGWMGLMPRLRWEGEHALCRFTQLQGRYRPPAGYGSGQSQGGPLGEDLQPVQP
jgi:hypothetical protein